MKVVRLGVVLIVAMLVLGLVEGAPLDVKMVEMIETKINTTDIDQNGNSVVQYTTNVTGVINVTNNANENLYDIWIALNLKNLTGNPTVISNPSYATVTVYSGSSNVPQNVLNSMPNSSQANYFIHITILKPNDVVSIFYDVDDASMGINDGAPFDVSEKYNVSKIPVDAVNTWHVTMNISVNYTWFAKTALDFSQAEINLTKYLSNDPKYYGDNKWQLLYLSDVVAQNESGGNPTVNMFDSVYNTNDSGNYDAFYVVDVFNNSNRWLNVTFNVTGQIKGVSELYKLTNYGFATLKFDVVGVTSNTVSGSHIIDAFAVSDLNMSVNKSGPYQNSTGQYALWIGNATIKNPTADLTYNITAYTLWATPNDVNQLNTIITDENNSQQVIKTVNPYWILSPSESQQTIDLMFNYSNVPVIWANVTFTIIHNQTYGWWSYENTTNKSYIVLEKIYVIKGYLIKVTKHLLWNDTANAWDVYIVIENIGGMKSPNVWVYDLIPNNYTINWSDSDWRTLNDNEWVNKTEMFIQNKSVGDMKTLDNVTTGYWYALAWELNPLEPNADKDGSYTDWSEIANNQSVVIHYQMSGSGIFHPMDAFVVGVDPMFSMDPQTAHKITIVSGAKSTSYESLMVLATGIIGIVAMAVVRRR